MNTMPKDDFNDSLEDLIGAPARPATAAQPPAHYQAPTFEEPCPRCRGTGRYAHLGACFKCKGTGKQIFKTSRDERQKARSGRTTRKAKTAAENVEAFKAAHPAVFAWMDGSTFPFAVSLLEAVGKFGSLTENQMAAALRSIEKLATAKAASAARVTEAKPIDMTAIEAAFARASAKLKRPRLTIADMVISPAKATSANAGMLYVKSAGAYLGKISNGKFIRSRECTAEQETAVVEMAADPKAVAIRHGKLTGRCAVCNRALSDPASVAAGIGPICSESFGW